MRVRRGRAAGSLHTEARQPQNGRLIAEAVFLENRHFISNSVVILIVKAVECFL